jgi:hypothetical protein
MIKIIGIKALKKKSTEGFAIADGKAKEIPWSAQDMRKVKNDAILFMTHVPILVPSINQVISSSTTIKLRTARHFTFLLLGEQRKTRPKTTRTPRIFNKKNMSTTPYIGFLV